MQKLIDGNWIDCTQEELQDGDTYRISVGGGWQQQQHIVSNITDYAIENLTVTVDALPANNALTGDYVADVGADVVISCSLVDGAAITYPGAVIKVPIVRHADGSPTDDEIYFNATIIDGVLTASGTIPRSGDWKLLTSRINKSLARIGATWAMNSNDIGLLV